MSTPIPARLLAGLFCAFLISAADAETALGQDGDWQVRLEKGTTGMTGDLCVISTVSDVEGGRRERPRIRIIPSTRQIVVDPDRYLSGVITGVAVLEHRSDRRQPQRVLEHRARIDEGEIFTSIEKDPRFGAVEVTKSPDEFARIMRSMSTGKLLRYEWQLDRGSRSYEYGLAGFASMLGVVDTNPACNAGGN